MILVGIDVLLLTLKYQVDFFKSIWVEPREIDSRPFLRDEGLFLLPKFSF
ncbi:hypothetical protein BN164_1110039 [Clostridioides difficile T20]|nr:hypothetical protein BN164_1110039 [Clostridioides difficile T20]